MSVTPPLPSAPITEAVIDLRISPLEGSALARLKELQPDNYPVCQPCSEFSSEIKVGPSFSATTTHQELGYLFRSNEHPYVFQARLNGFTFSRLKPYETWDLFAAEALNHWKRYRALIGQSEIKRLAVRYINRIDIPLPVPDLSKYFRTRPEISDKLQHRDISGLMMFLQLPQSDINAVLNFRQAVLSPPEDENVVSFLIDIDLYRSEDVPQDDDEIWEYFNRKLRQRKDDIFFASLTKEFEEELRKQGG